MEIIKREQLTIPFNRIRTQDQLIFVSDLCVSKARDLIIYIHTDFDVETMMKYGLFPTEKFSTNVIDKLTMDDNTYNFWHRQSTISKSRFVGNAVWYYSTLETHKINGIQFAVSFPLLYLAPHLVYNGSKRPKNDMSMFRGPLSLVINSENIINNTVNISEDVWNVIPVTRYGRGMSKGMYYQDASTDDIVDIVDIVDTFCGTFYYYEPESTTYLAYKTSRTYFNKTTAAIKLGEEFNEDFSEYIPQNISLMEHINGNLPSDLLMTPKELSEFIVKNKLWNKGLSLQNYDKISPIPRYVGMDASLKLYSSEDGLDQILCNMGKKYGIDIIIFTHMVGSYQVVTEILDTRDRMESFKSLIYTELL
jgi:hypothetical protein